MQVSAFVHWLGVMQFEKEFFTTRNIYYSILKNAPSKLWVYKGHPSSPPKEGDYYILATKLFSDSTFTDSAPV